MNREGKKCVLYPRVSTEMQVDGYSLEGQKNSLKRFADSGSLCKCGGKTYESGKTGGTCGKDSEIRTAGGRYGLLRNKYRAFEIRDDQVSQTLVDGNLCSIAEFIRHCDEGSIITLHTMEGEPFLIGLSKMFVFCGDKAFLDRQLIPYLRSMGGESV